MNNDTKNEVKKNVATCASTAAGATTGVVLGAALSPERASPEVKPSPKPTVEEEPIHKPEPSKPEPTKTEPTKTEPTKTEPEKQDPVNTNPPKDEVEVIGYERVTNDDGSQVDIAVLNVNGNEVGVIDANLDGEADAIMCDINHNGIIEEGEVEIVQGQGIAMAPLADAAGFNPQFAQNDLPDYINDAEVDTYMA